MDELVYTIDDDGRLSGVNEAWDAFATANDAPELIGPAVLGRPFLDFISGRDARHLTQSLMRRAVESQAPVVVPFDCDSSSERRQMEMTITRVAGGFEFRTRTRSSAPRPTLPLLERNRPASGELLLLCSWCNRVKVEDRWMEIEEAAESLQFLDMRVLPGLTHGICQTCSVQVLEGWTPSDPPVRT